MTNEQKRTIAELRSKGATYAKIGEALGISKDTAAEIICPLRRIPLPLIPLLPSAGNAAHLSCRQKNKRRGFSVPGNAVRTGGILTRSR